MQLPGLWRHHKLGWYSGIASVPTAQIIAITGFLDEERVKHFLLAESVNEQLTASDLETLEDLVIPLFTGTFFICVTNMVLVTVLTLPAILSSMKMPPRCPFFKNKEGTLNKAWFSLTTSLC